MQGRSPARLSIIHSIARLHARLMHNKLLNCISCMSATDSQKVTSIICMPRDITRHHDFACVLSDTAKFMRCNHRDCNTSWSIDATPHLSVRAILHTLGRIPAMLRAHGAWHTQGTSCTCLIWRSIHTLNYIIRNLTDPRQVKSSLAKYTSINIWPKSNLGLILELVDIKLSTLQQHRVVRVVNGRWGGWCKGVGP